MASCVVAVLVLSGCADAPEGPLRFEDHGLSYCSGFDGGRIGFGVGIPLDHEADGPITIRRIASTRSEGVRIVGAVVVKVRENRVGTAAWPLPKSYGPAVEAKGAAVPSNMEYDLVVHVVSNDPSGGTAGVVLIDYTEDGRNYTADTYTTVRMQRSC